MKTMTKSSVKARLERSREQIGELEQFIQDNPPFTYVLETDRRSQQRSTMVKKDAEALQRIAILAGEALHNIRSALDHAYFEIVSPHVHKADHKLITFPCAKKRDELPSRAKSCRADRVSDLFHDKIIDLGAHPEEGGNKILYILNTLNIDDKHRRPVPIADFKNINSATLQRHIPDFPSGLIHFTAGANRRDICWRTHVLANIDVGQPAPGTDGVFEKPIEIDIGLSFFLTDPFFQAPFIPTLKRFVETCEAAIDEIYAAAR